MALMHLTNTVRLQGTHLPGSGGSVFVRCINASNASGASNIITKNNKHLVRTICSQVKNKSVKLQFVTENSKHFVGTICSHMKNKSVKLPFVTKNSKHLVGTSGDDVSALIEFTPL